jgi:hypothetical protein
MITWTVALYGAVVSGLAAALLAFLARERSLGVIVAVGLAALLGPLAWNAILITVNGRQFFVDAPIAIFPVSWQDTGSGVFAVAASAVIVGLALPPEATARRLALLSVLSGIAALVVDVFLY